MEDNQPDERPDGACAGCGRPAMEGDYPTPLCDDCRERFTRLSIPLWIKLFAAGIAVILVFSLSNLPKSIALGIHLRRGEKAMEQHRYRTAETELKQVLEKVPDNVEANGHLLIAAFYNQDFGTMGQEMKKLHDVRIDDDALLSDINAAIDKEDQYFSNDSFENFRNTHPEPAADTAWSGYFAHNPGDRYALMEYASAMYDKEDYDRSDSLLRLILKADDEYIPALVMSVSIKRKLGDLDRALRYSKRILEINRESALGMDTEARVLLAQKKFAPALGLALEAYGIDHYDAYSTATLILAYHFNGHMAQRDALIKDAGTSIWDSTGKAYLQYASDVVNKKEMFR